MATPNQIGEMSIGVRIDTASLEAGLYNVQVTSAAAATNINQSFSSQLSSPQWATDFNVNVEKQVKKTESSFLKSMASIRGAMSRIFIPAAIAGAIVRLIGYFQTLRKEADAYSSALSDVAIGHQRSLQSVVDGIKGLSEEEEIRKRINQETNTQIKNVIDGLNRELELRTSIWGEMSRRYETGKSEADLIEEANRKIRQLEKDNAEFSDKALRALDKKRSDERMKQAAEEAENMKRLHIEAQREIEKQRIKALEEYERKFMEIEQSFGEMRFTAFETSISRLEDILGRTAVSIEHFTRAVDLRLRGRP